MNPLDEAKQHIDEAVNTVKLINPQTPIQVVLEELEKALRSWELVEAIIDRHPELEGEEYLSLREGIEVDKNLTLELIAKCHRILGTDAEARTGPERRESG